MRIRAHVGGKARVVRRASQCPLVWDIVQSLVFVSGGSECACSRLERHGVWVLRDLCRKAATSHSPGAVRIGERYRGHGRVVREERNIRCGVNMLEMLDLHANHALSRGVDANAKNRSWRLAVKLRRCFGNLD